MDSTTKATTRLISLDAMRGFTIAAMIMVNFPGDEQHVFLTLQHTKWNGLTFTDLIAPVFLFIVGVSIAFAYSRRLTEHKPALYKKIAIRSVKIFAVGMFLNMLPYFDFSDLRYTGTLHRIAIVFFFCAVLFLNSNWKQQAITCSVILIIYWLAMTLIPTPGMGQVIPEPGKNLAAWVDQQFLPGKMWQGNWDPEGILSTFPAIVSGISGMLAGKLLISDLTPERKTNYLMTAGLLAASAGYFWGLVFPVNENLWTSSFVLVTSGFACMLLGTMYFVIDILGKKRGTSLGIIFGANAIAAYVLADILALLFYISHFGEKTLNQHFVDSLITAGLEPRLASWFYALIFVCINFIPVWLLYRRKIFIKL